MNTPWTVNADGIRDKHGRLANTPEHINYMLRAVNTHDKLLIIVEEVKKFIEHKEFPKKDELMPLLRVIIMQAKGNT